jgi:hypothetical protein
VAEVIQTLAAICEDSGDYRQAEKFYERSLKLLGRTQGESSADGMRVDALIGSGDSYTLASTSERSNNI